MQETKAECKKPWRNAKNEGGCARNRSGMAAEWLPTTAKRQKRERNAIYHGEMPLDQEFFISLW